MPAKVERRESVPVIIAIIVAVIGALCLWSELRNDSLDRGGGVITSEVVSRAGATMAPTTTFNRLSSELPEPQSSHISASDFVGSYTGLRSPEDKKPEEKKEGKSLVAGIAGHHNEDSR
jgi:hypothetical protein